MFFVGKEKNAPVTRNLESCTSTRVLYEGSEILLRACICNNENKISKYRYLRFCDYLLNYRKCPALVADDFKFPQQVDSARVVKMARKGASSG